VAAEQQVCFLGENGPLGWLVGAQEANLRCVPIWSLSKRNNLYPACYSWSKATRDLLAIRGQAPYPINEVLMKRLQELCTRSP